MGIKVTGGVVLRTQSTLVKFRKNDNLWKNHELFLISSVVGFYLLMSIVAYFANETDKTFLNNRKATHEESGPASKETQTVRALKALKSSVKSPKQENNDIAKNIIEALPEQEKLDLVVIAHKMKKVLKKQFVWRFLSVTALMTQNFCYNSLNFQIVKVDSFKYAKNGCLTRIMSGISERLPTFPT